MLTANSQPGALVAVPVPGGMAAGTPPIILQYWQLVRRWRWVILAIVASALVVGLIATLMMTPRYTASVRVEISREQKNITNVQGVESEQVGRDLEFYSTQYALLEARSLAERVARALNLKSDGAFFEAHGVDPQRGSLFGEQARSGVEELKRREALAVELLLDHIEISPVRGSSLVDVRYTSNSPAISARIANAWSKEFVAASVDRRFASTADARELLERRLTDLRGRLEQSERDLVRYAGDKRIVSLSTTVTPEGKSRTDRTLISENLEALNAALARATAERVAAESLSRSGSTSAQAISSPTLAALRERRAGLAADYARLMVQFEPGYPQAKAVSDQIAALDRSIAREESRISGGIGNDIEAARSREQALRTRVDQLTSQLAQQNTDSIQLNIYQREVDTNRQLYEALLQRYKEIGVAGVGASNIAIIDPAKLPEKPSAPNLKVNLALALLAGLVLAGLTVVALNQIDEGFRDPNQIPAQLKVPLLGTIPLTDRDTLDELRDTKSPIFEAYLAIRSSLAFSTDHGFPRTLAVTSTRPAEGKSTSCFALATVLGRTGKRVVLIDADMRSPSVHTMVGLSNEKGLSNYLAGDDDWAHLVSESEFKNMMVLPAGPTPPSAGELLTSDRLHALLDQLMQEFDHVLIDSPPILGLADAPLLTRAVEGCVLVVESNGVAVRGVQTALRRLNDVHAHVVGAIFTKLDTRQTGYGYGYGYGYGQGRADRDD